MITFMPFLAMFIAISLPKPLLPPVITATLVLFISFFYKIEEILGAVFSQIYVY